MLPKTALFWPPEAKFRATRARIEIRAIRATMDLLPDEMIMEIFRAIDRLSDRALFSTTCKRFKKIYDNENSRPKQIKYVNNGYEGYIIEDSASFLAIGHDMYEMNRKDEPKGQITKLVEADKCLIHPKKCTFPNIGYILFEKYNSTQFIIFGISATISYFNLMINIKIYESERCCLVVDLNNVAIDCEILQKLPGIYSKLNIIYDIYLKNTAVDDKIRNIFKSVIYLLDKINQKHKLEAEIQTLRYIGQN